ncbi:hypothetical protein PCE1_002379 [Barthelona sp. PCE]
MKEDIIQLDKSLSSVDDAFFDEAYSEEQLVSSLLDSIDGEFVDNPVFVSKVAALRQQHDVLHSVLSTTVIKNSEKFVNGVNLIRKVENSLSFGEVFCVNAQKTIETSLKKELQILEHIIIESRYQHVVELEQELKLVHDYLSGVDECIKEIEESQLSVDLNNKYQTLLGNLNHFEKYNFYITLRDRILGIKFTLLNSTKDTLKNFLMQNYVKSEHLGNVLSTLEILNVPSSEVSQTIVTQMHAIWRREILRGLLLEKYHMHKNKKFEDVLKQVLPLRSIYTLESYCSTLQELCMRFKVFIDALDHNTNAEIISRLLSERRILLEIVHSSFNFLLHGLGEAQMTIQGFKVVANTIDRLVWTSLRFLGHSGLVEYPEATEIDDSSLFSVYQHLLVDMFEGIIAQSTASCIAQLNETVKRETWMLVDFDADTPRRLVEHTMHLGMLAFFPFTEDDVSDEVCLIDEYTVEREMHTIPKLPSFDGQTTNTFVLMYQLVQELTQLSVTFPPCSSMSYACVYYIAEFYLYAVYCLFAVTTVPPFGIDVSSLTSSLGQWYYHRLTWMFDPLRADRRMPCFFTSLQKPANPEMISDNLRIRGITMHQRFNVVQDLLSMPRFLKRLTKGRHDPISQFFAQFGVAGFEELGLFCMRTTCVLVLSKMKFPTTSFNQTNMAAPQKWVQAVIKFLKKEKKRIDSFNLTDAFITQYHTTLLELAVKWVSSFIASMTSCSELGRTQMLMEIQTLVGELSTVFVSESATLVPLTLFAKCLVFDGDTLLEFMMESAAQLNEAQVSSLARFSNASTSEPPEMLHAKLSAMHRNAQMRANFGVLVPPEEYELPVFVFPPFKSK